MGRGRSGPATEDDEEPAKPVDWELAMDATAAMEKLGPDESLALLWRRGDKGRLAFAGQLPLADVAARGAVAIQEVYGGGEFVIRFSKGDQSAGHKTEIIEGDPIYPSVRPRETPGVPTAQVPSAAPTTDIGHIIKEVITEQGKQTERLVMMVVGAMGKQKGGDGDEDVFNKAIRIAELMKGESKGGLSEETLVSIFTRGMDTAEKINQRFSGRATGDGDGEGGGGDADPVMGVLNVFGPTVAKIMEKKLLEEPTARPALPPAAPAAAAPVTPPPTPAPVAEAPVGPVWLIHLKPYLKDLLALAKQDKDPDLYSEVLLDRLPDNVYDELQEFAKRDDFVELVLTNLPAEFQPYPVYMKTFVGLVKEKITAPESPLAGEDEDDDNAEGTMG